MISFPVIHAVASALQIVVCERSDGRVPDPGARTGADKHLSRRPIQLPQRQSQALQGSHHRTGNHVAQHPNVDQLNGYHLLLSWKNKRNTMLPKSLSIRVISQTTQSRCARRASTSAAAAAVSPSPSHPSSGSSSGGAAAELSQTASSGLSIRPPRDGCFSWRATATSRGWAALS
jgi:hypothetical protein